MDDTELVATGRWTYGGVPLAESLRDVVTEAVDAPIRTVDAAAGCYQPSGFAEAYEAHKRACGWYEGQVKDNPPTWYPRMFAGPDYALYEQMMQPYATRLAGELAEDAIEPDWIPYCPGGLEMDAVRQTARLMDPVWPQERCLQPREWDVFQRVDGRRSVGEIAAEMAEDDVASKTHAVAGTFWRLYMEGYVLFQAPFEQPERP